MIIISYFITIFTEQRLFSKISIQLHSKSIARMTRVVAFRNRLFFGRPKDTYLIISPSNVCTAKSQLLQFYRNSNLLSLAHLPHRLWKRRKVKIEMWVLKINRTAKNWSYGLCLAFITKPNLPAKQNHLLSLCTIFCSSNVNLALFHVFHTGNVKCCTPDTLHKYNLCCEFSKCP